MKKKRTKPYWEMTTEELREATKEYDRGMPGTPGKPLTSADRTLHSRANRKGGRPTTGSGVKVISLSVEKDLLARADVIAKQRGMSRSALIAKGLEAILSGAV
jgi:hypothetical protein